MGTLFKSHSYANWMGEYAFGREKTTVYKCLIQFLSWTQRSWGSASSFLRTVHMTVLSCRYAKNEESLIPKSAFNNLTNRWNTVAMPESTIQSVSPSCKHGVMPDGTGWNRQTFYTQPSVQHLNYATWEHDNSTVKGSSGVWGSTTLMTGETDLCCDTILSSNHSQLQNLDSDL